jgi:shikimate O-hydroxycinnamoyltransferase
MAASRENYGFHFSKARPLNLLTHSVNLRKRMALSLSEFSFGNLLWIGAAQCMDKDDLQVGLHGLVGCNIKNLIMIIREYN